MSKFTDIVKEDTPKLVIKFRIDDDDKEQYEWGIAGNIPLLSLIGAIIKTQIELSTMPMDRLVLHSKLCPEQMLVIAYAGVTDFTWFTHRDTPQYGMLGMLEMIRATLVDTTRARQSANQQVILGLDGNPLRR